MSNEATRGAEKPFAIRKALPWLVGAGVYALLLLLGQQLLNDPDSYSHVAVGRWIIAHRSVPATDLFSFSMKGEPWIAFEWLSQVIYATAYALCGWAGIVVLAAASVALAAALLARFLLRHLPPVPALLLIMAAFILLAPHILARPHVLTLPIMVAWAVALVNCMDRRAPPPYWALPLLVVWANLHGSVVLALGLIGPAVLEEMIERPAEWLRVLRRWIPFTLLAVVACCLTPYGPHALLIPLTTLGLGSALNWIAEWRPQDFGRIGSFELLLLAGIFGLTRGVTLPLVRALVVLGLIHFALAQVRNADLLAILAPLYLAAPLAHRLKAQSEEGVEGSARGLSFATLALMIGMTTVALMRDIRPSRINTPEAAIANADLVKAGPVLNDYSFGGYLIFTGIPTFIDGRGEIYGGPFIARYNRAISLADLTDFFALLDQYKISATLLMPDTPAVALLDRQPDWQRVYADDVAVVHKRREVSRK